MAHEVRGTVDRSDWLIKAFVAEYRDDEHVTVVIGSGDLYCISHIELAHQILGSGRSAQFLLEKGAEGRKDSYAVVAGTMERKVGRNTPIVSASQLDIVSADQLVDERGWGIEYPSDEAVRRLHIARRALLEVMHESMGVATSPAL